MDFKTHPKRSAIYPNMTDDQIDEQVSHIRAEFPEYDNEDCMLEILGNEDDRHKQHAPGLSWKEIMYQE